MNGLCRRQGSWRAARGKSTPRYASCQAGRVSARTVPHAPPGGRAASAAIPCGLEVEARSAGDGEDQSHEAERVGRGLGGPRRRRNERRAGRLQARRPEDARVDRRWCRSGGDTADQGWSVAKPAGLSHASAGQAGSPGAATRVHPRHRRLLLLGCRHVPPEDEMGGVLCDRDRQAHHRDWLFVALAAMTGDRHATAAGRHRGGDSGVEFERLPIRRRAARARPPSRRGRCGCPRHRLLAIRPSPPER
jgi:hypothetical protein